MKINFSTVLTALTGKPLQARDNASSTMNDLTLGAVAVEGLLAANPEAQETGDAKVKAYKLAQLVHAGGEVDLEPEDVAFIKAKIAAVYGPAVVGPAYALLNG